MSEDIQKMLPRGLGLVRFVFLLSIVNLCHFLFNVGLLTAVPFSWSFLVYVLSLARLTNLGLSFVFKFVSLASEREYEQETKNLKESRE